MLLAILKLVLVDMMKDQINGSEDLDADALKQLSESTNGYAVFGNKPYLGQRLDRCIDDSDESDSDATYLGSLRPLNGFYTSKNQFIPAAAITHEHDLIEKLRVHRSLPVRAHFDYEHSSSMKHSFDEYCYLPHGNATSKLLSNNGGKLAPCFDMMQLNTLLTLPPLLR